MKEFKSLSDCYDYVKEHKLYEKSIDIYIVYSADNWTEPYSELSRTYVTSTSYKYFDVSKLGTGLYGSCLDGTDECLRLNNYDWKIDLVKLDI